MGSKKYNKDKYDDNDLCFIPLNIESPLGPNSSKFPLNMDMDGVSITKSYGAMSLDFPSLNFTQTSIPLQGGTNTQMAPITPITPIPPITPIAPQGGTNTKMTPITPYPENIPDLESESPINSSMSEEYNTNTGLDYPSELQNDFLYSYNENRVSKDYLNTFVNPLDILRNFDISSEFDSNSRKNDCTEDDVNEVFIKLEKDNTGILATMKAYRVPYPIAKLLIKKIIKISLDNCKR